MSETTSATSTTVSASAWDSENETYGQWDERVNGPNRLARRARMERDDWAPEYSSWRHGGSYITNVILPGGGCGCIASALHTISGKFESACFDLGTFPTRDAAARAERAHAIQLWAEWDEARVHAAS